MSESTFQMHTQGEERFARHRAIDGWDQERLQALGVVVFGAGALGNEALKNLALLGVGRVLVVDMDRIEASNLTRSVLFRPNDTGRPKAVVACERLREIWPGIEAHPVVGDLHFEVGPGWLARYDLALACLDSLDARLGVDRLCRRAGIPWWNGGLGVSAAEVQGFDPHDGPCFACTLTTRALAREAERWSCQSGLPRGLDATVMPTTAISASIGGALIVQAALHGVLPAETEKPAEPGARILVAGSPPRLTSFAVARSATCPGHDDEPGRVDHPAPLGPEASTREILESCGLEDESIEVHLPHDLLVRQHCSCPEPQARRIPLRLARPTCPKCGEAPRDVESRNAFRTSDPLADLPLARLGMPPGGEIVASCGGELLVIRLALEAKPAVRDETERSSSHVP